MSETFHEFCVSQVRRLSATIFQTGVDPAAALKEIVDQIEFKLSRGEREFVIRLIDTCLEISRHCPNVADMTSVANSIRGRAQEARESAQREQERLACGEPKAFDWGDIDMKRSRRRREEREVMERWIATRVRTEHDHIRRKQLDSAPISTFVPLLREAGYPKTDYQREVLKAWEDS